jgi:hypothetical protein
VVDSYISRIRPKGKDNRRRSLAEQPLRHSEAAFLMVCLNARTFLTLYHVVDNMGNSIVGRKTVSRSGLKKARYGVCGASANESQLL